MELTGQLAFFPRQNSKEHVDHILPGKHQSLTNLPEKVHQLVWDAVDVLVDAVGVELPLILTTSCTCGTLMPCSFHLLDKSDFRF